VATLRARCPPGRDTAGLGNFGRILHNYAVELAIWDGSGVAVRGGTVTDLGEMDAAAPGRVEEGFDSMAPVGHDVESSAPGSDVESARPVGHDVESSAPGSDVESLAAVDKLADAVDGLVAPADTVGNQVLVDQSRAIRWAGPLFVVCAALLIPWIVVIALTLPSRQLSPNYDIAWAGFDVMLFAALACTAGCALRRSTYLSMAASWCAGLLVTDAWLDLVTTPGGRDRVEAIAMAAAVELPLTLLCGWLARHSQDITEKRLELVLRRARRTHSTGR
jgi:hypothetical protein